jgi:hypothetical protein
MRMPIFPIACIFLCLLPYSCRRGRARVPVNEQVAVEESKEDSVVKDTSVFFVNDKGQGRVARRDGIPTDKHGYKTLGDPEDRLYDEYAFSQYRYPIYGNVRSLNIASFTLPSGKSELYPLTEEYWEFDRQGRLIRWKYFYLPEYNPDFDYFMDIISDFTYGTNGRVEKILETVYDGKEFTDTTTYYQQESEFVYSDSLLVQVKHYNVRTPYGVFDSDKETNYMYSYKYDEKGHMVQIDYYKGESHYISNYTYDDKNQLIRSESKNYSTGDGYEYDEAGRIAKRIFYHKGEYAGRTEYDYDEFGHLVAKRLYVCTNTDKMGVTNWHYEYDSRGNVIRIHGDFDGGHSENVYSYDSIGNCIYALKRKGSGNELVDSIKIKYW